MVIKVNSKVLLVVTAVLLAAGIVSAIGLTADPDRVTSITLNASATPSTFTSGDKVRINVLVSVRGGPAPVTYTVTVPNAGSYEQGSITMMVDHNGAYGFDFPSMKLNLSPGTYDATVKATSGAAVATKNIHLVVNPYVGP
jgi:hypothetical protein